MTGPTNPDGTSPVFGSAWSSASYSKTGAGTTGFNNGNDDGIRYASGFRWCVRFSETNGDLDSIIVDGRRLEGPGVNVASEEDVGGYERLRGNFALAFVEHRCRPGQFCDTMRQIGRAHV